MVPLPRARPCHCRRFRGCPSCFAAHALELPLRRAPRQDDTSLGEELLHALEQTSIEARAFLGE